MSIAGVTRELLVRYLDVWAPTALHARRATAALALSEPGDEETAVTALRVFAEFADRLRGRRLAVVLAGHGSGATVGRLAAVRAGLNLPAGLDVHGVDEAGQLGVALGAAGAAGAPLFAFLATTGPDGGRQAGSAAVLAAVAKGRPAEVLEVGTAGSWAARREAILAAGFTLTSGVELVADDDARLIGFASSAAKSLEAFKNALWSVDEYAGVRYRDPHDPEGHLLDISLRPHPGPLRRELLAHLRSTGGRTVTELRHFTLTGTVYRTSDTTAALTQLLTSGAVTRDPESGRLAGDVRITAA